MFLNKIKNILASLTQILLPKQTFPNLATEETFLLVPSAAPERCSLALRMRCSLLATQCFPI